MGFLRGRPRPRFTVGLVGLAGFWGTSGVGISASSLSDLAGASSLSNLAGTSSLSNLAGASSSSSLAGTSNLSSLTLLVFLDRK